MAQGYEIPIIGGCLRLRESGYWRVGMSFSAIDVETAAVSVSISDDALSVELSDGRSITVPLAWFPRLAYGSLEERNNWRFAGNGSGIHWPELDEDISVENLLSGKRSGESHESLKRWLDARQTKGGPD